MSINIIPYPTASGMSRAIAASIGGISLQVKYIAVGKGLQGITLDDAGRALTDSLASLVGYVEVLHAKQVSPYQWQITVDLVGVIETEWNFSEFALCDSDKQVIAIYGSATQALYTISPVLDNALLSVNLVLGTFPANSIIIEHHNQPLELFQDVLIASYTGLVVDVLKQQQHDIVQDHIIDDHEKRLLGVGKELIIYENKIDKDFSDQALQTQAALKAQQREFLTMLAWKQATDAMYIRARGWSGLMAIRQYTYHGGSDNLMSGAGSEKGTPGHIHQHPEFGDLLGTGEVWAVINGWQFKARHRDHHLEAPAPVGSDFLATVKLDPPALPATVTGTLEQQTAAITALFHRFKNGEWPEGFRADLTALEVWIEPYSSSISDTFHSERHALQTNTMTDALRLLLHYSASGLKDRFENQSVEMPIVAWIDASGDPKMGILRYRMVCTSLESLGDIRPMLEQHEDVVFNVGWGRDSGRYTVTEGTGSPGALDTMMGMLPGLDGAGASIIERHSRYGQTESIRTWTDKNVPLNAAYYNRFAQAMGDDAANMHHFIRGDYDPYLFVASNTRAEVIDMAFGGNPHRWSWAIPMEIVIRTPLESWNPHGVPVSAENKGYGLGYGTSASNPIPGLNPTVGMYFKTPAELYDGASHAESADTATGEYWVTCGDGAARKMRASGIWITTPPFKEGIGGITLRYPIHPEHQEGDKAYAHSRAVSQTLTGSIAALMADDLKLQQTGNQNYLNELADKKSLEAKIAVIKTHDLNLHTQYEHELAKLEAELLDLKIHLALLLTTKETVVLLPPTTPVGDPGVTTPPTPPVVDPGVTTPPEPPIGDPGVTTPPTPTVVDPLLATTFAYKAGYLYGYRAGYMDAAIAGKLGTGQTSSPPGYPILTLIPNPPIGTKVDYDRGFDIGRAKAYLDAQMPR